ncbi:Metallo-dependent hydrolase, partial [Pholiota conissans]
MQIYGPAAAALDSLSRSQIEFLQRIPKAELHAHLNGSIPIHVLQELAAEYLTSPQDASTEAGDMVKAGIEKLVAGPALDEIHDFFHLFPAIYALTATPDGLARATRGVLSVFLDGDTPQCTYLELRSTPKATEGMDRERYLNVVLDAVERYPADKATLIISLDRRMGNEVLKECIQILGKLKKEGRRVVGIDLCGDPKAGDMAEFAPYFAEAHKLGLGVTLHIAEV